MSDPYTSMKPAFIDMLAVDFVVTEHRFLKLTIPERRHAAHRLLKQGLMDTQVCEILHISYTTFRRITQAQPPPILDVNSAGNTILVG